MASPQPSPPRVIDDCHGVLQVLSDGSIRRSSIPPFTVPVRDDGTVHHKDLLFHPAHDLRLRLYLPTSPGQVRLPVLFYFHGGGFCIGSRTWPNFHNYCIRLASDLRAIVVAPDYRLAPEHRLPAALDDAEHAVEWLLTHNPPDPWLAESADLNRVFISGDSAGGNIVHHLAARLNPDRFGIRGFILLMPFFGGVDRTRSEAECPVDAFLTLEGSDRFWRLSLPVGEGRDNPMANPFGTGAPELDRIRLKPMLVVVGGNDLLSDRAKEYSRRLKEWNTPVELVEFEGVQHGFLTLDPFCEPADELMRSVQRFMEKTCSAG